jgi:hypothetical protein
MAVVTKVVSLERAKAMTVAAFSPLCNREEEG